MPGKLKILLGMLGINLVLNIANAATADGSWIWVIISAIALGFLSKGSNKARIFILIISFFALIGCGIAVLVYGVGALFGASLLPLIRSAWVILLSLFGIYTLTRSDIKAYFKDPDD